MSLQFITHCECGAVIDIYSEHEKRKTEYEERHISWHKKLDERIRSAATVGESGDRAAQMSQPLGG